MKPFQTQIYNIVEGVNEIFLTFIIILMFLINSESKWKTYEDFFMSILIMGNLVIVGIMIGKYLKLFSIFCTVEFIIEVIKKWKKMKIASLAEIKPK